MLFVLLYFFLLAIVFSVLFRFTDFYYPFGIFKLFLYCTQYIHETLYDLFAFQLFDINPYSTDNINRLYIYHKMNEDQS
jgi:hypothetical protein